MPNNNHSERAGHASASLRQVRQPSADEKSKKNNSRTMGDFLTELALFPFKLVAYSIGFIIRNPPAVLLLVLIWLANTTSREEQQRTVAWTTMQLKNSADTANAAYHTSLNSKCEEILGQGNWTGVATGNWFGIKTYCHDNMTGRTIGVEK